LVFGSNLPFFSNTYRFLYLYKSYNKKKPFGWQTAFNITLEWSYSKNSFCPTITSLF
jgi:hypothetical protein